MDGVLFNMEVRRFLKQLGVGAQREIEAAVAKAIAEGRLSGTNTLKATARIEIEAAGLKHEIAGDIRLG